MTDFVGLNINLYMKNIRSSQGKLTVIAGPMYSGKTGKLIAMESVLRDLGKSIIVYKPSIDTRYTHAPKLHSHDAKTTDAVLLNPKLAKEEVEKMIKTNADVVVFDEVQFFDAEKVLALIEQLRNAGKHVIAAGLLYDYQRKPFGATPQLLGLSDEHMELFAICQKCAAPARHSQRVSGGKGQVDVGAGDKYIAVCEKCHEVYRG